VIRAGNHLAVACLFFGAAFAAFVSGSVEQRIGNLFSFGLIPAVGFYAGGHTLGQLLVLGVELCDMIMARCFRYAVRLVNDPLSWAGTHVPNGLNECLTSGRHITVMYKLLKTSLSDLWRTGQSAKIDKSTMRRVIQRPLAQLVAIIQPASRAQADRRAREHI